MIARFDIHLDPVTYESDEEYLALLDDPNWTKSETDQLLELARRYELRWAVIYDRWYEAMGYASQGGPPPFRKIEDLQHRYYAVAAMLWQARITREAQIEAKHAEAYVEEEGIPPEVANTKIIEAAAARSLATTPATQQPLIAHIGTGSTNKVPFDLQYERERREHLEKVWNRTKEEDGTLCPLDLLIMLNDSPSLL